MCSQLTDEEIIKEFDKKFGDDKWEFLGVRYQRAIIQFARNCIGLTLQKIEAEKR